MKQECPKCVKNHGNKQCLAWQNVCFSYGKPRHKIWECSNKNQHSAMGPQHQGRVFTLNAEDAAQSKDLIQGECQMNDTTLTVLYDSGATYSFTSLSV